MKLKMNLQIAAVMLVGLLSTGSMSAEFSVGICKVLYEQIALFADPNRAQEAKEHYLYEIAAERAGLIAQRSAYENAHASYKPTDARLQNESDRELALFLEEHQSTLADLNELDTAITEAFDQSKTSKN